MTAARAWSHPACRISPSRPKPLRTSKKSSGPPSSRSKCYVQSGLESPKVWSSTDHGSRHVAVPCARLRLFDISATSPALPNCLIVGRELSATHCPQRVHRGSTTTAGGTCCSGPTLTDQLGSQTACVQAPIHARSTNKEQGGTVWRDKDMRNEGTPVTCKRWSNRHSLIK